MQMTDLEQQPFHNTIWCSQDEMEDAKTGVTEDALINGT